MAELLKNLFKSLKKRRVKILLVFLVGTLIILPTLSPIAQAAQNNQDEGGGAWGFLENAVGGPILNGLNAVLYGILMFSSHFLKLCAYALNAVLNPALYNFMEEGIVQEGWRIVRDVVNLFFILILLVIAFATILRLETYDIKRMLPKLLVIALLINFSKMICGLIIDISQILMNTFLNAMAGRDFSVFVARITQLVRNVKLLGEGTWLEKGANIFKLNTGVTAELGILISLCIGMAVIFLILTVLLLIRIIALWILIILAPLAWFIGIIPTGKKFANQWWENFIKYCFFGPVMAFFLYLSWKSFEKLYDFIKAPASAEAGQAGSNFFAYITVMVLLIASAIAAKSMGVAGAGFMISGAKRLAGWGTAAITRKPKMWTAQKARGAGIAMFGKTLGRIPGLQGVARRMRGAEKTRRQAEARKEYGKYYAAMSPEDLKIEAEHAMGAKRAVAAEVALGRGYYYQDREAAERAKTTFKRFGFEEHIPELEKQQPDIAEDVDKVLERIGISGAQKLTGTALTPRVMQALRRQFTASEFAKIFSKWAKETRTAAEEAMRKEFTTPEGKINVEARNYFAKATGKVAEAFKEAEAKDEAKKYIRGLKAEPLSKLRKEADWEMAGRYMGVGQVEATGLLLSEEQKDVMRIAAREENPEVYEKIQASETWVGPIVRGEKGAKKKIIVPGTETEFKKATGEE